MSSQRKLREAHRKFLHWLGDRSIYVILTIIQSDNNNPKQNDNNKSFTKGARSSFGVLRK